MNSNNSNDVIYFELNNWQSKINYPDAAPFSTWVEKNWFLDKPDWVKENNLIVVAATVDVSVNYCITATKKWVEDNCPELLTTFDEFTRNDKEWVDYGIRYGEAGYPFLNYDRYKPGLYLASRDPISKDFIVLEA